MPVGTKYGKPLCVKLAPFVLNGLPRRGTHPRKGCYEVVSYLLIETMPTLYVPFHLVGHSVEQAI